MRALRCVPVWTNLKHETVCGRKEGVRIAGGPIFFTEDGTEHVCTTVNGFTAPITSSSSDSPLCTSITPSLFYPRLKTYLFHKSYPPSSRSFTSSSWTAFTDYYLDRYFSATWFLFLFFYPHMPMGKVWIYRLLFVFFVCTVTDFFGEDKASGVKFYTVVHGRPGQRISHFWELCSPEAQNRTNRPPTGK